MSIKHPPITVDELRGTIHDSCYKDPELAKSCSKGCHLRLRCLSALLEKNTIIASIREGE